MPDHPLHRLWIWGGRAGSTGEERSCSHSRKNSSSKWRIGELSSQETQHINQNLPKKRIKRGHRHHKRPRNHLTSSNLALRAIIHRLQSEPGSRTATAHTRKPCHSKKPPSETGQERSKSLCSKAATADRILHQKISFFPGTRRSWKGDEREKKGKWVSTLNNEAQRKRRMREKGRRGIQPIKIATFAALLGLATSRPAPQETE